jgi:hypothetical protein
MSDLYSEILVRRKDRSQDMMIRILLIAIIVACCAAGIFFSPYLFLGAIGFAILSYILFPRMHVEYEYLYVNGEFDIDEIFSREKRKKLTSFDLANVECVAPLGSHELDRYQVGYAVCDYSAQDPDDKPYVIVMAGGGEKKRILVQLDDEKVLTDIKHRLPRKVFDF